jgi:Uma2 family endonuclease
MTAAAYFSLPETVLPEQVIEGEYMRLPTPPLAHQRVRANLLRILDKLLTEGKLCAAPLDVVFDNFNIVQPDVLWLAEPSRCQIVNDRLYGPPELVVEILSPSTARYDRVVKFQLYERHGVPEYWIVDLDARTVEVWQLVDAHYQRVGIYLPGAALTSPVLGGKTIETASIFPPA